jgi:hypothetical protein
MRVNLRATRSDTCITLWKCRYRRSWIMPKSKQKEIDTDEFSRDLAGIVAKQLVKVASRTGKVMLNDVYRMQDATSLFSPYTFDLIVAELRNSGLTIVKGIHTE